MCPAGLAAVLPAAAAELLPLLLRPPAVGPLIFRPAPSRVARSFAAVLRLLAAAWAWLAAVAAADPTVLLPLWLLLLLLPSEPVALAVAAGCR